MPYLLQLGVGSGLASPIPDNYSDRSTLVCPETVRITFTVFGQGVFLNLLRTDAQDIDTQGKDHYYAPGFYSLERKCGKIRVKNAVAGSQAQIALEALTANDLPD